ncbi:hypothetical protein WJX84_010894 [Apatococcus fuscideae]|uniref:phosphoglycerate dehydrogenase n=1 Tax=Apatococcus fuscideae TaxID=2026836 RepID=A0AAW1SHP3_9CHLO
MLLLPALPQQLTVRGTNDAAPNRLNNPCCGLGHVAQHSVHSAKLQSKAHSQQPSRPSRSRRLQACVCGVLAATVESRPTILVSEKLGTPGLSLLEAYGNVDQSFDLTPEQLCEKAKTSDALIIRSATQVTRAVFEAANGKLKVVGRAGVGVDNVDLEAATEYGCLVVNAPTANTVAAAEHGIALLAALSRNIAQADASTKNGKWQRGKYVGVALAGKTLAIFGFGKVGAEVARRARGLGLNVIAHDPFASETKAAALHVKLVSFEEALSTAEFFSLHMPLTPGTKGIFGTEAFSKIKKGARIVNVARGGVIDDVALAKALDDKIVAEAVIDALKGELAATAVNAPMVPPEVLAQLQPFVTLAQGLGRAATQLVGDSGFTDVYISYTTPRSDDLDTRLLRAMVIKGILESITTSTVNLVNADLLAKSRGLRIIESTVPSEGRGVLTSMAVSLGTGSSKFSAALDYRQRVSVAGTVKDNHPYLIRIGIFDVDLALEGTVLLCRQQDRPGIIAAVSSVLASNDINISFMSVARLDSGQDAIMALGLDHYPSDSCIQKIRGVEGIAEFCISTSS